MQPEKGKVYKIRIEQHLNSKFIKNEPDAYFSGRMFYTVATGLPVRIEDAEILEMKNYSLSDEHVKAIRELQVNIYSERYKEYYK